MPLNFDFKLFQYLVEILVQLDGNARVSQFVVEYLIDQASRDARISQHIIETGDEVEHRDARISQFIIEVAFKNVNISLDYLDEAAAQDFTW